MTSNTRFDSMGINKQIVLDLYLSFGLSEDVHENVLQFINEMHTKLGLNVTAYITPDSDANIIKGDFKKTKLDYQKIATIASAERLTIIHEGNQKSKDFNELLDQGEEALIYRNSCDSYIFLSCKKERNLISEKVLEQLLDRFNFFISQLIKNQTKFNHNKIKETLTSDLIENIEQNILVLDKDLNVQQFNYGIEESFKRNFGIDLKIGEKILQGNDNAFDIKYQPMFQRVLAGEDIKFNFTTEGTTENDKKYHAIVTFKPIRNEANEIIGIISYNKDVTELVNINRQLEKRESTLNTILDSTPDGIYAVDKNMEILVINEQARQDFKDYTNVNLKVGDNLNNKISKEILDQWKELYFNKIFNNESIVVNTSMVNKAKKQTFFVENRYIPVKDNEGDIFAALEVCRDITELNDKERNLEVKEGELRLLLEKTPTGIAKLNLKGKVNFINKRASDILGIEKNEILNKSVFEFIHRSEHEKLINYIATLLNGKDEVSNIFRANHPTKDEFYINGLASINKDSNGQPFEFILSFNNITEKVLAQQNLDKSRKRYKSILEGSPAGLAQVNEDGKFIFVSKRGADILGSDAEQVLSKGFLDYIDVAHKTTVQNNLDKLTKPDELIDFRVKGLSDKGDILYLDGTATLLQDDDAGNSTLFIFNDVTSRVLAEKELAKYNEEIQEKSAIYKALIDGSFDGIDIIELEKDEENTKRLKGKIVIRNDRMYEYMNNSDKAFIDLDEILTICPEYQSNGLTTEEVYKNIIKENFNNNLHHTDWRIKINGEYEDFHHATEIIRLKDKTLLIRNLRKVTEMKKQQEIIKNQLDALSTKNDELEKYIQSNLQLENFAYIASHDLKAPLRTVSSFAFLLKQKAYENLDEKSKNYLDIVLRSSTNMQKLIDDLLAFSRVGTQKVNYKKLELTPMLNRILLDLNTNIKESKAEIIIGKLPKFIYADESMMIQIFLNLFGNALKFSREGIAPVIELSSKDLKTHWQFTIKDNGIGIKEENKAKIFGIFEKLHSNDIFQGTGLGLSICKKITEIHEGEIRVESELGSGSTFIFRIKKEFQ